jgi:hypothetical protein
MFYCNQSCTLISIRFVRTTTFLVQGLITDERGRFKNKAASWDREWPITKLHCVGASENSYKVALYLNCAGVDWEPVGVDFAGGQTRDAKWRADINAMGEIPVLEVNGKRMSQSGGIDVSCWATSNHRRLLIGRIRLLPRRRDGVRHCGRASG